MGPEFLCLSRNYRRVEADRRELRVGPRNSERGDVDDVLTLFLVVDIRGGESEGLIEREGGRPVQSWIFGFFL